MPIACSIAMYAVTLMVSLGLLAGAQADLRMLMKATATTGCHSVALLDK
jgi:hypothetical protein